MTTAVQEFVCTLNECGRKFVSKKKLDEHIRLDHVRPDDEPVPLHSRAIPVVPSTDPDAPYGCDEQGNPLKVMRSDTEIAKPLLHDPALRGNNNPTQPVRSPSRIAVLGALCELEPMTESERIAHDAEVAEQKEQLALASAREMFGLNTPSAPKPKAEKFVSYREALGLTQSDLLDILDRPLPFTIDETETTTVLNDPAWLKNRIELCRKLIEHHEQKIVHWGIAWLKRNRPDNIPEPARREKFKRDSRVKIEKNKTRLAAYRKRLRDFGSDPRDQQEVSAIVKRTATLGDYDLPDRFVKRRDYLLLQGARRETYCLTNEVHEDEYEPGIYTLDRYREIVNLTNNAIFVQQNTSQSGWAKWENVVVEKGVQFGIIPMTDVARVAAPRLAQVEPEEIEADTTEDALISKTGGAAIGGRVYGRGWRWRPGSRTFVPRKLDDFTRMMEHGDSVGGGGDWPDGPSYDMDSGDWSPGDE